MNFYKTLGLKNSRIDVADALRGLAVAGIILYHSVEHFNMYDGSIEHAYTLGCDDWMADVLALLLSVSILVLIVGGIADVRHMETWNNWLYPIYNFFILSFVVSGFVLLWYGKEWFRKGLSFLRQFGKMSLTNYFLQSIIGCGLFAYYGFNLQTKLGITYAFFVGIAMVVVQCLFSNLWLKYHSHGPFEGIWKKLTWIKF